MWIGVLQAGWATGIRGRARGDLDFFSHKKNDSAKLKKISVSADYFFHYGKSFYPQAPEGLGTPEKGLGSFDLNSQC